jgi:tetratricopeptide (TPR) repeat protein
VLLERTIGEDPGNPALHAHLVHCYERQGAWQKAIRALRHAAEEGAATDDTYARLGANLLRVGDRKAAARALERAVDGPTTSERPRLATALTRPARPGEHAARGLGAATLAQAWNVLGRWRPAAVAGRAGSFREAVVHDPAFAEPYSISASGGAGGPGTEVLRRPASSCRAPIGIAGSFVARVSNIIG